jgi:hypothetical protein
MAVITKTVKTSGGDYANLAAAVAGMKAGADNTSANSMVIECYAMNDTAGGITLDAGWNITALTITVPIAERHDGTRGTGYRNVCSIGGGQNIYLRNIECPVTIDGIAARNTSTADYGCCFLADNTTRSGLTHTIKNCLFYNPSEGCIEMYGGASIFYVINNITYGGQFGIEAVGSGNIYCYNNTILNPTYVGFYADMSATCYVTNCYVGHVSADAGYFGTMTKVTSPASDSSGTSEIEISACDFTNATAGSENANIAATSDLMGAGTYLASVLTDFYGRTRANPPAVGAAEYVAEGGGGAVGAVIYYHHRHHNE